MASLRLYSPQKNVPSAVAICAATKELPNILRNPKVPTGQDRWAPDQIWTIRRRANS
jgi:hypothetical protein